MVGSIGSIGTIALVPYAKQKGNSSMETFGALQEISSTSMPLASTILIFKSLKITLFVT